MKILIDIGHPAHVHFFKNIIIELEKIGYECFIISRNKNISLFLFSETEKNIFYTI